MGSEKVSRDRRWEIQPGAARAQEASGDAAEKPWRLGLRSSWQEQFRGTAAPSCMRAGHVGRRSRIREADWELASAVPGSGPARERAGEQTQ